MRFTRFAVVVFATIGLILGLMPAANAGHTHGPHENPPSPPMVGPNVKAMCQVNGSVTITPGVELLIPRHNHYQFNDPLIECTATIDSNYNFAAVVNADGGTDGACSPDTSGRTKSECGSVPNVWHGENDAQGWSHSDGYGGPGGGNMCDAGVPTNPGNPNANRGDIIVSAPKAAVGWVKFVRVGVAVTAWGYLNWTGDKKDDCFLGEFVFTPTGTFPPVTTASLTGVAVIYN